MSNILGHQLRSFTSKCGQSILYSVSWINQCKDWKGIRIKSYAITAAQVQERTHTKVEKGYFLAEYEDIDSLKLAIRIFIEKRLTENDLAEPNRFDLMLSDDATCGMVALLLTLVALTENEKVELGVLSSRKIDFILPLAFYRGKDD